MDKNNDWAIQQNGYRLFIVVDAQGRIAYMVYNPVSGYGSPYEASHYTNGVYKNNIDNNPALNLYTSSAGRRYDVFVPQGGFALTAHGAGTEKILGLLGIPNTDLVNNINKACTLSDDVRLGYDSNTNTIFVYK